MYILAIRLSLFAGLAALGFFPALAAAGANSWWGLLPFVFCFAVFSGSLLGWGKILARRDGLAETVLLGSAAAVVFAFLAGQFGWLSARLPFFLFLPVGAWKFPAVGLKPNFSKWVVAIFGFALGLRGLSAFFPQAHGDPLLYHLSGPALWAAAGRVQLNSDLPNAILASSWEYFYLWPQLLFRGAPEIDQLLAAQIFSQWIHLFWGGLGIAVLVERISRSFGLAEKWRFLFPLAALFVASIQWTAGLAKNDAGIAFWCLGAWIFLERALREKRREPLIWSAVFTALAITGKVSAILFLGPFFTVIFLAQLARTPLPAIRAIFVFVAATLLAALPVYLRNFSETGNPFFPMFARYFPSVWVSASWEAHFSAVQPAEAGQHSALLLQRIRELLKENIFIIGWLALPFAYFWNPAAVKKNALWLGASAISFFLFSFAFFPDAELRYLGASLIMLTMAGLYFFLLVAEKAPARARSVIYPVLLLALLAASKLPTHLLWKFPKMQPGAASLIQHTAGDSKAWLRQNTKPGELVVMVGDNESYYLLPLRVTVLTERPDLDRETRGSLPLPEFVEKICRISGATYLLDSRAQMGLTRRFPLPVLEQAVAFQGVSSRVYDLRELERKLGQKSDCGRVPAPIFSPAAKTDAAVPAAR